MHLTNRDEIYEFGPFRLSTLSWSLQHNGTVIHLPKLEFVLLLTFLRQPKVFITPASLVPDVWPDLESASHRALQEHIYRLNQALKVGSGGTRYIQLIRGKGYRLFCEVRRAEPGPSSQTVLVKENSDPSEQAS
jgi:DNA-binding response OmpR family regulator